jgi:hypothetical protein
MRRLRDRAGLRADEVLATFMAVLDRYTLADLPVRVQRPGLLGTSDDDPIID